MRHIKLVALFPLLFLFISFLAVDAQAQTARPQFYVVCYSQPNQAAVYFSGILQGPATALQAFRAGFLQFLVQTHSYQGNVACLPTNNPANAQLFVQREATALTNAKKNVVQTGWTEPAPAPLAPPVVATAAPAAAAVPAPAASPAAVVASSASQTASKPTTAPGGSPTALSVLNSIFGTSSAPTPTSASSASAAKPPQSQTAAQPSTGGANAANSSPATQVASTLTNIFGKKSANAPAPNSAGKPTSPASAAQPPKGTPSTPALPDGALGSAEFSNTKLIIYGCGRQALQVACVADLFNENAQDTLMKSSDVWKDAFIVDDRGDRHERTNGFFLNIDGDQRQQLDVSYGKSTKFVLMFDNVQTKVQKVTLRSATGGLNVQDIQLIVPATAQPSGQAQAAPAQASATPVQ